MKSTFAPLGSKVFRMLWIAGIVSNIGSWMQTVGAQWLLVENNSSPVVVALVQTAAAAPVLLLAVPAGVLGEFLNRRTLLLWVQGAQLVVVLGLTALTLSGAMTPALLLTMTFLLGACSAVQLPAYQAVVPDVVPPEQISNAAVLSSTGVNVARAIGPALAGLLVAQLGVTAVFIANALSFAVFLAALLLWRGYQPPQNRAERFLDATRAGLRYIQHAGVIRGLYFRLALFLVPANALWALLPVIASDTYKLGPGGYGLLLAAVGLGSIAGALLLPWLRNRVDTNATISASAAIFGLSMIAVMFAPSLIVSAAALVVAGAAWIGVIATINGTVQAFLPIWVRVRGLSVYQLVLYGSTALGAAITGGVATYFGVTPVMVTSGIALLVLASCGLVWPSPSAVGKGRSIVPLPLSDAPPIHSAVEPDRDAPVLVLVRWAVEESVRTEFAKRMLLVSRARRRTGARDWALYDDREDPAVIVEAFRIGSWQEHLNQHMNRTTEYDESLIAGARSLASADPVVEHLIMEADSRSFWNVT